ncbi:MAG: hypothetical protein LUC31_01745 [Coprobacillus sp.]|nr:hypothetical protein [Coprobacillus sp.]
MITIYLTWNEFWENIFGTHELWGLNMGFWVGIVVTIILVVVLISVTFALARHPKQPKVEKVKKAKNKRAQKKVKAQ